jgi:TonB family protein
VRKASESPDAATRDSSPALHPDRTAEIGAFGGDGVGITRSSQWSLDGSAPSRFNPYLFALVLFALVAGGAVLFHQLFWDGEPPQRAANVYVATDNLFVRSLPPGADVAVNGKVVGNTGSAGLNLRIEPGREHLLVVRLDGHQAYSLKLTGESAGQRRVDARLAPLALASRVAPSSEVKRPPRKRRARHRRSKSRKRPAPVSGPTELREQASAIEASRDPMLLAGLDTATPELAEMDAELLTSTGAQEAPTGGTELASATNSKTFVRELVPDVAQRSPTPTPGDPASGPEDGADPPPAPPDEPVVQSTAEVMRRRTAGANPEYPRRALQNGLETTLQVRVVITPAGRVSEFEFLSGEWAFRTSVGRALRSWRFEPLVVGGRAVESTAVLKFVFKLDPA